MNMENREMIKDKIRKLLALGSSSNEHEAAVAVGKAEKLMTKYHLKKNDVDFTQETIKVEVKNRAVPKWENQLLSACCYPHNCYVVLTESGEAVITGRHQNVEVSKLMFAYLKETIIRLAKNKVGSEAKQFKIAMSFFLSIKIYAMGQKIAWMEKPNEYMAAKKYAASLMGKGLVVIPGKKKGVEVSRDVMESAGDMAAGVNLNRQTGMNGQALQITSP
jgi:hypothetical protein